MWEIGGGGHDVGLNMVVLGSGGVYFSSSFLVCSLFFFCGVSWLAAF